MHMGRKRLEALVVAVEAVDVDDEETPSLVRVAQLGGDQRLG